jgi:hypothetical protein
MGRESRRTRSRALSRTAGIVLALVVVASVGTAAVVVFDGWQSDAATSFEGEERRITLQYTGSEGNGDGIANVTQVLLTHTGGEALPIARTRVRIAGNTSVWGPRDLSDDDPASSVAARPVPDVRRTLGGGANATIGPGATLNPIAYKGYAMERVCDYDGYHFIVDRFDVPTDPKGATDELALGGAGSDCHGSNLYPIAGLSRSQEVSVVWRSASGDETRTVFTYTVQRGAAPYS